MSDAALSSGWQAIHGLQHYLEHHKWLDAATLAAEEALTDVLDAFLSGEPVNCEEINRRFHSRRMNRRRRNRRRENLLQDHGKNQVKPELQQRVSDASEDVADRDFLQVLEMKLDASSFTLLKRIAGGATYSELSLEFGSSAGALRTKASRIRDEALAFAS